MTQQYIADFNINLTTLLNTIEKLASSEESKAHVDRLKRRISAAKAVAGDDYPLIKSASLLINMKDEIMKATPEFIKYCSDYVAPPSNGDAETQNDINVMVLLREEMLQKLTEREARFIHKHVKRLLKAAIEYALDKK